MASINCPECRKKWEGFSPGMDSHLEPLLATRNDTHAVTPSVVTPDSNSQLMSAIPLRTRYDSGVNTSPELVGNASRQNAPITTFRAFLSDKMMGKRMSDGSRWSPFLPEGTLKDTETLRLIDKELERLFDYDKTLFASLRTYVHTKATTAFAILSRTNEGRAINVLKAAEYNDDDLPVDGNYFAKEAFANADNDVWSYDTAQDFCENQWEFMAPVFSKDGKHLELECATRLPYIDVYTTVESSYGKVHQVKIHPRHHNFSLPPDAWFAVKELKKNVQGRDKDDEASILRTIKQNPHGHLILALQSYEIKREASNSSPLYFIIFPWAEHGHLANC